MVSRRRFYRGAECRGVVLRSIISLKRVANSKIKMVLIVECFLFGYDVFEAH